MVAQALRVLACFAAVFSCAAGTTGAADPPPAEAVTPAEVSRVVALFNQVYHDTPGHVLSFSEFYTLNGNIPEDYEKNAETEIVEAPELQARYIKSRVFTHTSDGADGLLVEQRVVPPFGTGTKDLIRLCTPTLNVDFTAGVSDEAVIGSFDYGGVDYLRERIAAGRMTHEEGRAVRTESFLFLARWAARHLLLAEDLEGSQADQGKTRLASKQLHMTAEVDTKSGELSRMEYVDQVGDTLVWWWTGHIQGVTFPAAHPQWQYSKTIHADGGKEVLGNARRFDSIQPAQPKATVFEWSTYRPWAYNVQTGTVTDRNGRIDDARTERRKNIHPPSGKDLKPVSAGK